MHIGIVGCGVIAQLMHLPTAIALDDVEVAGLVDPDNNRCETLASRYQIEHTFADHESMFREIGDDLDGVLVLSPMETHAAVATAALEQGLHTFVEKPLALSVDEADELVRVANQSDAIAMVGYMKRYDQVYQKTERVVEGLDHIDHVIAYDVDPDHERLIADAFDLVEGKDLRTPTNDGPTKRERDASESIGTADPDLVSAYVFHVEHACHDVNLLRGLFGSVQTINHVSLTLNGRYLTASLTYEGDHQCQLISGDSDRSWFEEWIRIDAPQRAVTLEFDNPYFKQRLATLTVHEGQQAKQTEQLEGRPDLFRAELRAFIAAVRENEPVETTFAEARDDVQLLAELFREFADASDAASR